MQTDAGRAPVGKRIFIKLTCEMVRKSVERLSAKLSHCSRALPLKIKRKVKMKGAKGKHSGFGQI